MDLHFTSAQASTDERATIDAFLNDPRLERSTFVDRGAYGGRAARQRRDQLLPVLHAINDRFGWISEGALNHVCRRLTIPPAEAYGVASFYGLFSTSQRPPAVCWVCDDIACMAGGAEDVCGRLEGAIGPPGTPTAGGAATWQRSPCLGLCDKAPAASLTVAGPEPRHATLAPVHAQQILAALADPVVRERTSLSPRPKVESRASFEPSATFGRALQRRLLRRVGTVDPTSIDDYRAEGGYAALRQAFELGPAGIIREVTDSKLVGRGGAAFPTGRKWEAVAREPDHPHFLVCNADESEPGTFKDRVLMECDPFAIVEAMTIAALAADCARGFIYIRGEYRDGADRLSHAIAQARTHGLLGDDIMGRGFHFDIELRRGAGAYICGEETALFNSIEGRRGEPRNKPPFPVQKGLFGKPTVVNNVETLVGVLDIVIEGGRAFAALGTPESTGTKLFCVSGHVARPGLYEVPFGTRLSELLDLAGGIRDGKRARAVLLGGAAGTFLRPDELDVQLSFEAARAIHATLGSGVVFVLDEDADLGRYLLRIASFFREESCGQCVPCRVGTVRQEESLHRLATSKPFGSAADEHALLTQIGQVMRDASICGLGQTASTAIESALAKFDPWAGQRT